MKMFLYQAVVAIAIVLCSQISNSFARYGEICPSPAGVAGKCVPLRSCAGAYELLEKVNKYGEERFRDEVLFLQKSQCDSDDGRTPLICCPEGNIQIDPEVFNHLKNSKCGQKSMKKLASAEIAGLYEYRWMALLKYNGKVPFACGGSLIDERHVLTAAHCLHNFENLPIAVRLGEYNLTSERDCVQAGKRLSCLDPIQDIGIEKIIIHEDYVYKGIENDIAILRLDRPVNIQTKSVHPICLPITKELQEDIPDEFLVAGWGMTEYGNPSNVLKWTALPHQPNELCEEQFQIKLSEKHICAGGRNYKDTCKGDSGGPISYQRLYANGVSRQVQYGIVSLGSSQCGHINVPTIFTNIPAYMQWITDHLSIDEDQQDAIVLTEYQTIAEDRKDDRNWDWKTIRDGEHNAASSTNPIGIFHFLIQLGAVALLSRISTKFLF